MKKINRIKNKHIKSYKAVREDSSQVFVEQEVYYDSLGRELSVVEQLAEGLKTRTERLYDGKIKVSEKVYVNDKLQKESVFTYFNNGLIKSESVVLYFDRKMYPAEYISLYKYDKMRNLVSKIDSAIMDSAIVARHTYQYNSRGLLVLEDVDYADTTNQSTTYKYDANKNLMEKSTSNQDGKILEVVSYNYDKDGNMVSMRKFNAAVVVNHKYSYNDNGLIELDEIEIESRGDIIRLHYQYEFYE